MRDDQEKEIDGIKFRIQLLGFKSGLKAWTYFLNKGANAMSLGYDEAMHLASVMSAGCQFSRDGGINWPPLSEANQEQLFGGRLLLFYKWLNWACEVQFADFLAELKRLRNEGAPSPSTPVA